MEIGLGLTLLLVVAACTYTTYASDPVVKLNNGRLTITGKRFQFEAKDTLFDVDAYLGIPYAEPPVGSLRFKPTVPKELKGEFNAQEYGKICPQTIMPEIFPFKPEQIDEDCLIINVHVPVSKPPNAAVMVHIHGGGYMVGAGTIEEYDFYPMAALGDVIIVSMNYRLGALGFLSTADEVVPGNMGLFDQLEALKWVHKNIAEFGGDPNRVSIFGISAGGTSVGLHTLSPLSKGLFTRAIMQSGTATAPWSHTDDTEGIRKRAFAVGKIVGCDEKNTKQLVDCLMDVSTEQLDQAYLATVADQDAGIFLSPVVDGIFFPTPPRDLIKNRSFTAGNIDVLVGHTVDEATFFLSSYYPGATEKPRMNSTFFDTFLAMNNIKLQPLQRAAMELVYFDDTMLTDPDADYLDTFVKLLSDYMFQCPNDAYLRVASEAEMGSVYAYEFNFHPSQSMYNTPWSGACHGDDVVFFGTHFVPNNVSLTDVEVDMTFKMIKYWTNFAKTGNPNIASQEEKPSPEDEETQEPSAGEEEMEWPQYTPDKRIFKELSPSMKNIPDPSGIACKLWNDYLPKLDAALADKEDCNSHWAKGDKPCSEETEP